MRIVVACDGSEQSANALKTVLALPIKNASYTLIHVSGTMPCKQELVAPEVYEEIQQFNREVENHGQRLLEEALNIVKQKGYEAQLVTKTGSVVEGLLEYAKKADLFVMGARGLNPVKRLFLGSVSDALVKHAPCSVLLYRDHESFEVPDQIASFTIGFDDTEASRNACRFLNQFETSKISKVDLMSVIQLNFYYGMNHGLGSFVYLPSHKPSLEQSLAEAQKVISQETGIKNVNLEICSKSPDVASQLNEYAKKSSDLLIVGSQNKGFLDRTLLGSVSNRLAHHAECPLMIVR